MYTYLFTGRPSAGKTTIVEGILSYPKSSMSGFVHYDGDSFRKIYTPSLGYSDEDRKNNLKTLANKAKEENNAGKIVLASFISPTNEMRNLIRDIVGLKKFKLIHVECPLEVCIQRDVKGHYAEALAGKRKYFTGIDPNAPFEEPENPDLVLKTSQYSEKACIKQFLEHFGFK